MLAGLYQNIAMFVFSAQCIKWLHLAAMSSKYRKAFQFATAHTQLHWDLAFQAVVSTVVLQSSLQAKYEMLLTQRVFICRAPSHPQGRWSGHSKNKHLNGLDSADPFPDESQMMCKCQPKGEWGRERERGRERKRERKRRRLSSRRTGPDPEACNLAVLSLCILGEWWWCGRGMQ